MSPASGRDGSGRIRTVPGLLIPGFVAALAIAGALLFAPDDSGQGDGDGASEDRAGTGPVQAGAAGDTVGIRVLNATDIAYLAGDVQRFLLANRPGGLVLTAPGQPDNADRPGDGGEFDETVVAAHTGDLGGAVAVAGLLRLDESNVVWQIDSGLVGSGIDVTVYLGLDMEEIRGELVPYDESGDAVE